MSGHKLGGHCNLLRLSSEKKKTKATTTLDYLQNSPFLMVSCAQVQNVSVLDGRWTTWQVPVFIFSWEALRMISNKKRFCLLYLPRKKGRGPKNFTFTWFLSVRLKRVCYTFDFWLVVHRWFYFSILLLFIFTTGE